PAVRDLRRGAGRLAMKRRPLPVLAALAIAGCANPPAGGDAGHGAMDATSSVARADGGKGPRDPRIIPLKAISGDVEILKAGAFAFAPAGTSMFGASPEEAIVQVHGIGPFSIHWHGGFHTIDDADAGAIFTLRKGTLADTPRGPGRIVQGYASGSIVQYE